MKTFLGFAFVAVLCLSAPALAQFGKLSGGVTCGDDHGVGPLFKDMNEKLFQSYKSSTEALAYALEAIGQKEDAEKLKAQLKDLKQENAPKDTAKATTEQSDTLKAKLAEYEKSGKKMDAAAKKVFAEATLHLTKAYVYAAWGTALAAPIGINAKAAIDANKVCATSLAPAVDTAKKIVDVSKGLADSTKTVSDFNKKQGVKEMTGDERKKMMGEMGAPDDLQI